MKKKSTVGFGAVFRRTGVSLVLMGFVGLLAFGGLLASPTVAHANSGADRTTEIINLSRGAAEDNKDAGKLDLTAMDPADLQHLGVFLSNYYIPYVTEFGEGGAEDESLKKVKENMVTALTDRMQFDKLEAEAIVEYVVMQSIGGTYDLSWGFSETLGSKIEATNKSSVPVSLYELQKMRAGAFGVGSGTFMMKGEVKGKNLEPKDYVDACALKRGNDKLYCWEAVNAYDKAHRAGEPKDVVAKYKETAIKLSGMPDFTRDSKELKVGGRGGDILGAIASKKLAYGHLMQGDKKVFSLNIARGAVTPSETAYDIARLMVDGTKGYGTSFYDLDEGDDVAYKDLKSLGSSVLGSQLKIDTFGNIFSVGKTHKYIILPASMNPYIVKGVDEAGKETVPVGHMLNTQNFQTYSTSAALGTPGNEMSSGSGIFQFGTGAGGVPAVISTQLMVDKNPGSWTITTTNGFKMIVQQSPAEGGTFYISRGSEDTAMGSETGWLSKVMYGDKTTDAGKATVDLIDAYIKTNPYDKYLWHGINKDQKRSMTTTEYLSGSYSRPFTVGISTDALVTTPKSQISVFEHSLEGANTYLAYNTGDATKGTQSNTKSVIINQMSLYEGIDGGKDANELVNIVDTINAYGQFFTDKSGDFKDVGIDGKMATDYRTSDFGVVADPGIGTDQLIYNTWFTYVYAQEGIDSNGKFSKMRGKLGWAFDMSNMPPPNLNIEIDTSGLEASAEDQMMDDIRNWVWYLLNPTEGFNYVKYLVKNKGTALLMDTHSDIVGATNAPAVAGSTKYVGFSGYVTTPELTDLEWTDKMLKWYNANYIYIIIGIIALMGVYAVVGAMTLTQAVTAAVVLSLLAITPASLLNATIGASNKVSSIMYGQKFMYWALLQNQTYSDAIDKASTGDSYANYLEVQMQENSKIDITGAGLGANSKGADTVVVKWQSPKKLSSIMLNGDNQNDLDALGIEKEKNKEDSEGEEGEEEEDTTSNNATSSSAEGYVKMAFGGINNSGMNGQSYMDKDSTYLYRSYIDINNYSRFIYRGIKDNTKPVAAANTKNWESDLADSYNNREVYIQDAVNAGYNNEGPGSESTMRLTAPFSSNIVSDTFNQADTMDKLSKSTKLGIDNRRFAFSIPAFTQGVSIKDSLEANILAMDKETSGFDFANDKYTEEDYAGLAAYSLMSESPFFYYSWLLYDEGLSPEPSGVGGYKDLVLQGDGTEYFYNNKGNGEIKDYLDMRSLFTYTIPYLQEGNDVVVKFDEIYGLKYEPGIPTDAGHEGDSDIAGDPVMQQKYWKNSTISSLYGIYSPWVDMMASSSYAKSETVEFQGSKLEIAEPINPASYPDERPMIFSKSEQVDFGLRDSQLTTIERKILKVNENVQSRYFQLLNAYNFNDNVLNTAAAMEATFEFNKQFSETSVLGSNNNIYPQSYELKNFSYDAYLRLILSNTTGESIAGQSANDFYNKIVQNSSVVTAFILLVNDVASEYILPAFKLFLVVGIGLMMVVMILAGAIRAREGLWKSVRVSLIKPLVFLFLITVGHAFVVSRFMSDGNTSVTGYDGTSISLGDPVMVLLAMLAINLIVLILLFKTLWAVWKDVIDFSKSIYGSFAAVSMGAVSMVKGVAKGSSFSDARAGTGVGAGAVTAVGAASDVPSPTAAKRAEDNMDKVGRIREDRSVADRGVIDIDKGDVKEAAKKTAGLTTEVAGHAGNAVGGVTEAGGKVTEVGGKAVTGAGEGIAAAGRAAMAVPVVGTILGGAATVVGAATQAAGKGVQAAGRGAQNAGQAVQSGSESVVDAGRATRGAERIPRTPQVGATPSGVPRTPQVGTPAPTPTEKPQAAPEQGSSGGRGFQVPRTPKVGE